MKTQLFLLILTLTTLCLRAAADAPAVPHYAVTDLGPMQSSYVVEGVFALNDAGQAVGGDGHVFLWSDGRKTDLGTLPPDGPEDDTSSIAYGINRHGQIVGASGSFRPIFMSGTQFARGFVYQKSSLRQLTQRNASFEPYAINDQSQIVGLDGYRGFLYENGKLTQLGTLSHVPEGNRSTARAVNNLGQIAGWSTVNKGMFGPSYAEVGPYVRRHGQWVEKITRVPSRTFFTHACLWQGTGKSAWQRDLGTLPGWADSYAYGINDQGEVIGSVTDIGIDSHRIVPNSTYGVTADSHAQAFLWRHGKIIGLGMLPGCRSSEAFGINNDGMVVGQSDGKAFLWQEGKMRDLNALIPTNAGWVLTEARAVNNKGQIVGNGQLHGQRHAFLLTPREQD